MCVFALSLCVSYAYFFSKFVYKKETLESSTYIVNVWTLFDLLSTIHVLNNHIVKLQVLRVMVRLVNFPKIKMDFTIKPGKTMKRSI